MAANTKQIKRDVDRKPSPQYYNPVADEYEYLHGENGASRHILYSSDGQPITSSGNKLAVRASEIETLLSDIKSKDFATQTTLAQILAKIIAAPATEAKQEAARLLLDSLNKKDYSTLAKQNEILTKLAALETKLNGTLGIKLSGSNLTDATALPVRNKDVVITRIATNLSIEAGARVTLSTINQSNIDELAVSMRSDSAHTCNLWIEWMDAGGTSLNSSLGITPDKYKALISGTSRGLIYRVDASTSRANINLQNTDTVAHIYNAYLYEWRR